MTYTVYTISAGSVPNRLAPKCMLEASWLMEAYVLTC